MLAGKPEKARQERPMSTRYLSGAYPAGYTLSIRYSALVIEATASVGAPGVSADFIATITNLGSVASGFLYVGGTLTNGSLQDTTAQAGVVSVGNARGVIDNFATIAGGGSAGIYLRGGGGVTNGAPTDTAARTVGSVDGVYARAGYSAVANFGLIEGDGATEPYDAGVHLYGGTVHNGSSGDSAALIEGYRGVTVEGRGGLANYGMIVGVHSDGVDFGGHATLVNGAPDDTGATIQGAANGVAVAGAVILNYGVIEGVSGTGVTLDGRRDRLTNGAAGDGGAMIEGVVGVAEHYPGSATVTNFGVIEGSGGTAVELLAGDLLRVEAGCAFEGAVLGGGAALALSSGAGVLRNMAGGDVTVSGSMVRTTFTQFGALTIGKGADFLLEGAAAIGAGGFAALTVDGVLTVRDTLTIDGAVSGGGAIELHSNARLELGGGASAAFSVAFGSGPATLALADPSDFVGSIVGFANGDALDLLDIVATAAVLGPRHILTISDDGVAVADLRLAGSAPGETFVARSDGNGGTEILLAGRPAALHAFAAAAAGFGPGGGELTAGSASLAEPRRLLLAEPRPAVA